MDPLLESGSWSRVLNTHIVSLPALRPRFALSWGGAPHAHRRACRGIPLRPHLRRVPPGGDIVGVAGSDGKARRCLGAHEARPLPVRASQPVVPLGLCHIGRRHFLLFSLAACAHPHHMHSSCGRFTSARCVCCPLEHRARTCSPARSHVCIYPFVCTHQPRSKGSVKPRPSSSRSTSPKRLDMNRPMSRWFRMTTGSSIRHSKFGRYWRRGKIGL